MFYYKGKAATTKKNSFALPNVVKDCEIAIKVIQVGEWSVYSTLQLLEEAAADFRSKSAAARKVIPWPFDDEKTKWDFMGQVSKIECDEAADVFVKDFITKAAKAVPKSHKAFIEQLGKVFEGEYDPTLKVELLDSGAHITGRYGAKPKHLPMVGLVSCVLFVFSFFSFLFSSRFQRVEQTLLAARPATQKYHGGHT
jgi:hypothetical protein